MFAIILLFIGIASAYFAYKSFKNRRWGWGIITALVALFFFAGGATVTNQQNDSSSSTASSSSTDSSIKSSSERQNSNRKKAQSGVRDINNKISETPELEGLKVKLDKYDHDGEIFDVEVPDTVVNGTSSQQREIFKNIYTIISHETGNQNPTVYYYDVAGNEIAQTKWDGSIKME